MPGKTYDERTNGHVDKSRKSGGTARYPTTRWCPLHKTTSHSDAHCFKQGASRPKEGGEFPPTALGTHSLLSENPGKLAINFDKDFNVGFKFTNSLQPLITETSLGSVQQHLNRLRSPSQFSC